MEQDNKCIFLINELFFHIYLISLFHLLLLQFNMNTIINYLNSFDSNAKTLILSNKGLTNLPDLSSRFKNLSHLDCCNNQLTSLPSLNDKLTYLYCYNNQLTCLPPLNNNLTHLDC